MDKREEKTFESLYQALGELLKTKNYSMITVQDILDASKISRSTFYSHFKDKDDVLLSVCHHIFNHVFASNVDKEKDHDFSGESVFDYKHYLTHLFCHFKEEEELTKGILSSEGKKLFVDELKKEIKPLMSVLSSSISEVKRNVPRPILENQLIDSFVSLLSYWVENGCVDSPEKMTDYFLKLYE